MSYSVSGDTIICSSNTQLDCRGLYDRRSQDELWVTVWVCVCVCVGPCRWCLTSLHNFDGIPSVPQQQDEKAFCMFARARRRSHPKVPLRSLHPLFSLLTNPIPLCLCQFQVFSLWNAAAADFNKTN